VAPDYLRFDYPLDRALTTDEPAQVKAMLDKRFAKQKGLETEMQNKQTVKTYGDENSENVIVFFGSTKGAILEAAKYFEKPAKLLQIVWLAPFDAEKVKKELAGAKKVICVDGNHDAQRDDGHGGMPRGLRGNGCAADRFRCRRHGARNP